MKKVSKIYRFIIGNDKDIETDMLFLRISSVLAALFLFILCIVNFVSGLKFDPVILAGMSCLMLLYVFYLLRFKNIILIPKLIISLMSLVLLDITWYVKFLSNGPLLLFILIFGALLLWLWEGRSLLILLFIYFVNILVLFHIERITPVSMTIYPEDTVRINDIYISFVLYSVLLISSMYIIKMQFKRQKEKAINSEKLKSAFLANMSHEIRTPMNGILGFSELLKEPNLTGDKQKKYIEIIEKSGHRMLNIINDIIDLSKIESGLMTLQIVESNLNEQLEFIYNFFKPEIEQKGIHFSLQNNVSAAHTVILTDREKLYSILTNLIKNAIKYTDNGSISVGCDLIGANESKPCLQFYIKDSGMGISKDMEDRIFERFIRDPKVEKISKQGAGMGLFITKTYVEMLSGKIWLESEVGVGSTFWFSIPYESKSDLYAPESKEQPKHELKLPKENMKILIAEDDEGIEFLLTEKLEEYCDNILIARNGLEAVETCKEHPDIDLILMDIQMPSMDGYEATKEIRKFNTEVIIVAQTACVFSSDEEKALASGCNEYVAKPVLDLTLQFIFQKYFDNFK